MIDLRSDTLTLPDRAMLETILEAPLGDAARLNANGRGGDPTVNALEDAAAALLQKEAAAFLCSGTMGNLAALTTHCRPGDRVLIESKLHVYRSEKIAFSSRFGQLAPVFYESDPDGLPNVDSVEKQMSEGGIRLLCLENTHNDHGGVCLPISLHKRLRALCDQNGVRIHLDGARLFHAAQALGVSVADIAREVDTVMFCVSKGLGAPFGSLVCGPKEFIDELRTTQKLLGGGMRQAGVMAAPALFALQNQVGRLSEDHAHARAAFEGLRGLRLFCPQAEPQTNLLMLQTPAGKAQEFCALLAKRGLVATTSGEDRIRLVFYRGITDADVAQAVQVIREAEAALEQQ